VRQHVAAARAKHLDETGFRIGGRTQWLHIFLHYAVDLLSNLLEARQPAVKDKTDLGADDAQAL
jgi:hypothetical protein